MSGALGRWAKATDKKWFARGIEHFPVRWERASSIKGVYVEAANDPASDD